MDRSGTKEPIPSVKVLKARSADNHLLSEQHNGAMGTAELAAVMTLIVLGAVILLGTVGLAWVMFRPIEKRKRIRITIVGSPHPTVSTSEARSYGRAALLPT